MNYTIQKCDDKDDFDNMCMNESDGGLYSKQNAFRILENGNGGSMRSTKGHTYMVSYTPEDNKWLKVKLKL